MKFRKKPVVVEAEQYFFYNAVGGVEWGCYWDFEKGMLKQGPILRTLEGTFEVTDGDWIITDEHGGRWSVKDDIFRATYEAVENE